MRCPSNRVSLKQILINLISNALKFTEAPGEVTVTCAATDDDHGDEVFNAVRDTGRGIAPAHLAEIFSPFVQVDTVLTRTNDGVGLGLAISRDFALGMGGDLTVESELGVGTTFTLRLPRSGRP